jgi:periplasmic copper chaperone A
LNPFTAPHMRPKLFAALSLAAALALGYQGPAALAHGKEFRKAGLEIEHIYASATAPGQPHGAVFIKQVKNKAATSDRLVGGRAAAVAKSVEVHQMVMDQSVMRMREIPGVDIPAKGRVSMDRGAKEGYHLMLMNLTRPLADGDRFPMILIFQQAGEVEVEVEVVKVRAGHGHKH